MDNRENWSNWSPYAKTYDPLQSGSIDGTDTTPHDRALIRALEARYVPPHCSVATPNPKKTLFVGRLDHKTTEENLKHEFSRYGTVTHCRVVRDVVTGFPRGYAFVEFKHHEEAERARRDAHHAVLDGREILVDWESGRIMPGWVPRRLGGGFGGKKESGQLRFGGRDRPFRKPIIIKPIKRERTSLDEDDNRILQDPPAVEAERKPLRTELIDRQDTKDSRESRRYSANKYSNKVWSGRNTDERNNSYEQRRQQKLFPRDRRDWSERDDYYGKGEKYGRCSKRSSHDRRDRDEWKDNREDRRYSSKSFRNQRDQDECEVSRDDRRGSSTSTSSRYRENNVDRNDSYHRKSEKQYLDCRRSHEEEDLDDWDQLYERGPEKRKKRSARSRDRGYTPERESNKEEKFPRYSRDGEDIGDWDDTPERPDQKKYSPKSTKDRSNSEEDESHERKHKKKKRKHSKKSSRKDDSSDDLDASTGGKKKKKKHKKSSRD